MDDSRLGVIIPLATVVNTAHPLVWVGLAYDLEEAIPVRILLGWHNVIFIGQRPPDIAEGGEMTIKVRSRGVRRRTRWLHLNIE